MTEPSEPIITLDELMKRQGIFTAAIQRAVDGCYGSISSEMVAALLTVAHSIALVQAMTYYEIEAPALTDAGTQADDVPASTI